MLSFPTGFRINLNATSDLARNKLLKCFGRQRPRGHNLFPIIFYRIFKGDMYFYLTITRCQVTDTYHTRLFPLYLTHYMANQFFFRERVERLVWLRLLLYGGASRHVTIRDFFF
jgi:hypothetical protein